MSILHEVLVSMILMLAQVVLVLYHHRIGRSHLFWGYKGFWGLGDLLYEGSPICSSYAPDMKPKRTCTTLRGPHFKFPSLSMLDLGYCTGP